MSISNKGFMNNFKQETVINAQNDREKHSGYRDVLHALQEYRLWRDNNYVGKELGHARDLYVNMLKKRVKGAIEDYRQSRDKDYTPERESMA